MNCDYNTDTLPSGYCSTAAGTAAKAATCTYGYRDDATYFPCLFRYANTADNATLAISSYATDALPIYVNGARTSSSNTFGAGVIMFLYYNSAYYCYNDGRLPIVVNGTVTSVQDQFALYTKTASLAAVATSGSYSDLSDAPTMYPVGAIYISTVSTSPASLFGGTWTQLSGQFLLASNSTYTAGSTGGSATVTLTVDQMPSHQHKPLYMDTTSYKLRNRGNFGEGSYSSAVTTEGTSNNNIFTANTGGGQAHNNMPPYLAVYMWKRTA